MGLLGTCTLGHVKEIAGTPVVTKFVMLQALPIYPLESYYYSGETPGETYWLPFIVTIQSTDVHGPVLTRLDWHSVAMAYLRGICLAIGFVGFLALIPYVRYLTGEQLTVLEKSTFPIILSCFTTACVVGWLSYRVPVTPTRERRIRQYCGEQLGIGVDPARVSAEVAANMEARVARNTPSENDDQARVSLIHQLVTARANIAQGIDTRAMEQKTDELLTHLVQWDRYPR